MCGCDYAKRVHDLLDSLAVEQNRLAADALFATIAVIRGKAHEQTDERSRGISKLQFDALLETANKVKHAHMEEIAALTNKLSDYCGDAAAINNLSDTDCRSALTVACGLVHKYRAAYDAERAVYLYGVMQICAANEMTSEIRTSTSLFQQHVAEHSDKLHNAKLENDVFTECVSLCASKLRAQFGDRAARKGKKKFTHIAALERLTESAISQFNSLKVKCEALAEELRSATANKSSTSSATLASALESRLAELNKQCAAKDDQIEVISTKLRCSICVERDRDTAFACGHTFCKECATACAKCPMRCESERRHKPVRHTFRLYF